MFIIHDDWRSNSNSYSFTMDKRMAVSILTILYTLIFLPGILSFISVRKNHYINGKPVKLIVLQSLGAFVMGIYQFYGI